LVCGVLVNEYKKMIMTEMAMGKAEIYLNRFAKENNVYLERVATVIKCYYDAKKLLKPYRIHILTPSEVSTCE
jgi:hypothetical protein